MERTPWTAQVRDACTYIYEGLGSGAGLRNVHRVRIRVRVRVKDLYMFYIYTELELGFGQACVYSCVGSRLRLGLHDHTRKGFGSSRSALN